MQIHCSELATAVGGRLEGPDVVVDGGSIDSRSVRPGQLFVPVVAERDGHGFIADALAAGAAAYLTERAPVGGTAIVVDRTVEALQAAGRFARARLPRPVVGITGSVGKTSVKDLLSVVLAQRLRTAASERSFNNELGVPLTLIGAPDGTEAVVVEMGARGIGHIAELCAIASPSIGVVTRVAAAHTEAFGSIDAVADAKGELIAALPADGTAVLFTGDERVMDMSGRTLAPVVTFGPGGDVQAGDVELDADLRARFRLISRWGSTDVALAARGLHQVDNALAAAAVGLVCGLRPDEVAAGLATAELSPWRMDLATAASGARVLNDAYNANPTSMAAALRSLAALPAARRTAVLGPMAELGDRSDADHAAIGELAWQLGIRVVAVGTSDYGTEHVDDIAGARVALGRLGPDDAVLVKGSRVAALERFAQALLTD
jgi:UDP-N-acetylmuramoyl-tripeptide--D-alanyl-D-alanine ligase